MLGFIVNQADWVQEKMCAMLSVLDNVGCRSVESVIIEIEVHLADESGWRLAWNRSRRGGAFILNQKDGCTRQPSSSSNHHRKTDALARQFLRLPDQVDPLQTDLGTNWTEKFNMLRQSRLTWNPATQFIRYATCLWSLKRPEKYFPRNGQN